jgi:hypothetical protein
LLQNQQHLAEQFVGGYKWAWCHRVFLGTLFERGCFAHQGERHFVFPFGQGDPGF